MKSDIIVPRCVCHKLFLALDKISEVTASICFQIATASYIIIAVLTHMFAYI